jgi:hypothetical protein
MDFPPFLGESSIARAGTGHVLRRMEEREANFLASLERGVFKNPRSPYNSLLRLARCETGDVLAMVRDGGLEGTLRALRESGVHLTFEEFSRARSPASVTVS